MRTTFIYTLLDPRDFTVRYVGRSDNPVKRLQQHLAETRRCKSTSYKTNWLKKLLSLKIKPIINIMEEVTLKQWEQRERFWIKYYKKRGAKLVNSTDGGEGLINPSISTRIKIGKSKIGNKNCVGRIISAETRLKLHLIMLGKHPSPEALKKMSMAQLGRKHSIKTKQRISKAHKGRKHSDQHNAHVSASKKGKPLSQQTRLKMSLSRKGVPKSRAHAQAIGLAISKARRCGPFAKLIVYEGEAHCITEWAEITKIPRNVLRYRLDAGWEMSRVLGQKRRKRRKPLT